MHPKLNDGAALFRQKVIEGEYPWDALKEQLKLLLDAIRLFADFAIGPTEDAPALVNQAILAQ